MTDCIWETWELACAHLTVYWNCRPVNLSTCQPAILLTGRLSPSFKYMDTIEEDCETLGKTNGGDDLEIDSTIKVTNYG